METELTSSRATGTGTAAEVFGVFLKLGLTCFGGPIAHIGYFRREVVEQRRWLDEETYSDLVALCQFLPGPASSQVGFSLGLLRAGWLGGLAAWCGFTVPSVLLLLSFAAIAPDLHGAAGEGFIHGLKLVAVAVVAQAVFDMARRLCPDRRRTAIALAAVAILGILTAVYAQLVVICLGAVLGLALCRPAATLSASGQVQRHAGELRVSRLTGALALALFCALLFGIPVMERLFEAGNAIHAFEAFYRSGALVFGGGHVILPLLQQATVATGWVSPNAFLAGYGAAQAIPGPMSTFAAYLGWVMAPTPNHWAGAALATVGIFLPGLLLVVAALPYWHALRRHPSMGAVLSGVNAVVVGLLASALYSPVWTSAVMSRIDFAIAVIGFFMLTRWKMPPLAVVVFCALAGMLEAMSR
ncbi:chromate efflux transporter [Paraburkholderia bannensis]|uniref:chromate efflux transporter n=1 Tax=Paraburkholderia bannensis TaxID=765414 RepID=UPI002ABD9CEE|nr:chromate efflux transporter [Paraburkholderia bannensis]